MEGKQAKAVTSMEFTEIMGKLKATMESPEMQQKLARNQSWMYSWDNDKIHKGAKLMLEEVEFEPEDRFELPDLSSDMHKVVEHVHGWLQARMQLWLEDKEEEKVTVEQCKAELRRLFEQELTQQSLKEDVHSLHETYAAVVAHEGGYIPAAHR
jgi:hypothetical protein